MGDATTQAVIAAVGLNLGVGFLLGLAAGYALKKIAKLALIIAGLLILALLVLEYKGFITVDYTLLERFTAKVLEWLKLELAGLVGFVSSNVPFAGGFLAGFALGLKKG